MSHKHKPIVRNSHNWSEIRVGRILRRIGIRCKDGRQGCAVVQVAGRVQSAKWDSVSCVSMWWYLYIEGYIFVF